MKPRSGKSKARILQNTVAKDCARLSGLRYGRPDDDAADFKGRVMGQAGADLVRSEAARQVFPFIVEAKNTQKWRLSEAVLAGDFGIAASWWDILVKRCFGGSDMPILIVKRNHSPILAIFEAFWFVNTCKDYMVRVGSYAIINKDIAIVPWDEWVTWWFSDYS